MIAHRGYAYRPDGCLTAMSDETGGQRTLTLDPVGRITTVTAQGWPERYAYSPSGDIVHAHWSDPPQPHPAQGERDYTGTLLRRAGRVRYEHDAQGRGILRQRAPHSARPDTWRHTWDSQDRLVGVRTPDGTVWSYRYDALGRRVGKYRHDPAGGLAERVDLTWDGPRVAESLHWAADGTAKATTWEYHPDGFTPITQTDRLWLSTGSQLEIDRRFHTIVCDLIGAPTHLVDPDGDVNWNTQTTIWGTTIATSGGMDCPLRLPGQYRDPETGHHYNSQRHYDPETGRYLTSGRLKHALVEGSQVMDARGTVEAVAANLIQSRLTSLGRIGIANDDGTIPITQTLVLGRDDDYTLLRYTQMGLLCTVGRTAESAWLPIGFDLDEGEGVVIVDIETDLRDANLPIRITRIDGWIGVGSYDDVMALVLYGDSGGTIALTTTADLIEIAGSETAIDRARKAAAGQRLRLELVTVEGPGAPFRTLSTCADVTLGGD